MSVIAVYNAKGGVGKTTSCVNIVYEASRSGLKTLVWDLDAQGAASFYFGYDERHERTLEKTFHDDIERLIRRTAFPELDLIPSDMSYRNLDLFLDDCKKPKKQLARLLSTVTHTYDVVLLDCPPNLSRLADNISHAVDCLLIPVIPSPLSLRTHEQVMAQLPDNRKHSLDVWAFFSQVDMRKKIHVDTMESLQSDNAAILTTPIPALSVIEAMGVYRAPVGSVAPHGRAALAYRTLWYELADRLGICYQRNGEMP